MKKVIIMAGVVAIALVSALAVRVNHQSKKIAELNARVEIEKSNVSILTAQLDTFRVNDSLHACRVKTLRLSLEQFADMHREDMQTINKLKGRARELEAYAKLQTETAQELKDVPVRDTIIVRDTTMLKEQKIDYKSKWFDFTGSIKDNKLNGKLEYRDWLVIYETVRYKRFLGILWKTKKVKDRDIMIVNKNPNTRLMGYELVTIEE